MASPTVRAYATPTNGTDAAPAFTVTAPAGVATGDLLLAFAAGDTTTTAWTASPANGWTRLSNETISTNCQLAVYAKIADGTDGLSIAATNNNDYSTVMMAITTGTHGVTDVTDTTRLVIPAAASSATGNADPPNSGTVASKDWLAVVACACDFTNAGDSVSAVPSTYSATNVLTKSAASTSSVGLGVGHKALTAVTSENPGAFTNTSRPWVAKTILVRDASADDEVTNPIDPVGITDSVDLLVNKLIDLSPDAIGITDTADPVNEGGGESESVNPTDNIGITDTADVLKSILSSNTDNVGITDSATITVARAEAPVDNVGITDDADLFLERVIEEAADPIGITDTATLVKSLLSSNTDNIGITDTATQTFARAADTTDNLGITDTATLTSDQVVTTTDNIGITDNANLQLTGGDSETVNPVDNLGITDTATLNADRVQTTTDNVGITDDVVVTHDRVIEGTGEPIGITDTASLALSAVISATDNIGITDTATAALAIARSTTDNIGITDAVQLELQGEDTVSPVDLVGITDTASLTVAHLVTVTDPIGITDTAQISVARIITVSDPIGITDTAQVGLQGDFLIDICLTFGSPVFIRSVGEPVFVERSVDAPTFVDRGVDAPVLVDRGVDSPTFVDRDVDDPTFVSRDVEDPVFVERSTSITFAHGDPGEPTLICEE